ncbi:MAG: hypothetical protein U0525_00335 [Patescibacteria group bacterium]
MRFNKWITFTLFIAIVLVFSYFRLTIIGARNVGYTYDQGRDFIAGARIITDKNPVFIGPTTGIGGVFHGAWWYYFTALSFLILGPNPINFYISLFLLHLISLFVWFWGIRKNYDDLTALWSSLIIASGSYYVSNHVFAGNNILTIPSFTFMILTFISLLKNKLSDKSRLSLIFLLGIFAGFTAETELSFGIFLIPSLITMYLTIPFFRKLFKNIKSYASFFAGILIPFLPRLLFELKNGFIQTKVLLGFFTKPKLYNPRPYSDVIGERISIFKAYIEQALGSPWLVIFFAFTLVLGIIIYIKLRKSNKSIIFAKYNEIIKPTFALGVLLALLFLYCLVYRDPFWMNYYEGIQLGFLVIFLSITYSIYTVSKKYYLVATSAVVLLVLIITFSKGVEIYSWKSTMSGLKLPETIINYIVESQKSKNEKTFCARVFTPPVIPHTYDYLWLTHYLAKDIDTPRYDFINNECWYILEPEWKGFEFRQVEWKKKNIPENTEEITGTRKIFNGIEVYKLKQK